MSRIAWSEELSLLVGTNGSGATRLQSSPDGITWTARTPPSAQAWAGIAWSASLGLFVAVSTSINTMYSADGITWSGGTSINLSWSKLTYSPELGFCAIGASGSVGRVMTSFDGLTWTLRTSPLQIWRSVAWSPQLGLFSAVTNDIVAVTNLTMTSL
jgi:hypothetical protein